MQLIINGETKTFHQEKINIVELLKVESVEQPDMVSVQLNDTFLRKPDYDVTWIKDGDVINFLYFMGGGR
jgi:sulfur carrier protein